MTTASTVSDTMSPQFRIVCATRATPEAFGKTALGESLSKLQHPLVSVRLFPQNSLGLSKVYNIAIREAARDPAILLFAHDDIFLCDFFWPASVLSSLSQFDIVGVAGNRRRLPNQPSWISPNRDLSWDVPHLSGIVGHGSGFPPEHLMIFGTPGVEVKLLDGLLLIAQSETLLRSSLLFDERFDFHFYDIDFCRQAEEKNLKMGTSYVSVVHQSIGDFSSPAWRQAYAAYLKKWGS